MKYKKFEIDDFALILIMFIIAMTCILIFSSCQKQNCDCGTITDTGTTSLGNVKVELTTDCKTDWYVIYDTSRTWTKGDPGCIDDFGHKLNLIIHKNMETEPFSNCNSLTSIPELNDLHLTEAQLQSIFAKCLTREELKVAYHDYCEAVSYGYTSDSFSEWMNNDSGNQVYELNN